MLTFRPSDITFVIFDVFNVCKNFGLDRR